MLTPLPHGDSGAAPRADPKELSALNWHHIGCDMAKFPRAPHPATPAKFGFQTGGFSLLTRLTRFPHAEIVICIQMKFWQHAGTITIAGMDLIGREA
ncbi:hypothetical protein [Bosea sp. NPDC055594]